MKGWIEIFKSGTHTSSNGKTKSWSNGDLDKMVTSYSGENHEAPAVIGHPKSNDPAFGWLDKVKRTGNSLMGTFKQVAPEFAEMVKEGRFKKRSISVYPDGSIRHVGFLGAQPPAIKGLRDIDFSEDNEKNADIYEFEEQQEADMPTVEELQKQLEDEKKKREAAELKAKEAGAKADKSEADFAESRAKAKKKETADYIESGIKEGKILPAWKKQGLAEFMDDLDGQEETFEFSEGKKETRADWFKGFIDSFSEHPLFKEMAKKSDEDENQEKTDFAEADKLAEEMAAPHKI
jgi:hypothetical protein